MTAAASGDVEDALEVGLEGVPVGRSGQRVPLGQVLDVAQQDGVAQVEGGDGAELTDDRGDATLDAKDRP